MIHLMLMLLVAPAAANDRAKELFADGKTLYNQGRFEPAIDAWKEAYALDPRPFLLFNLANAYERIGAFDTSLDALITYRPDAKPEEMAALDERIASMQARVDAEKAEAARLAAEKAEAEAALEEERRRAAELQRAAAAAAVKKPSIIPPLVVTGVGVGLMAFGAVNGLAAGRARKSLRDDGLCNGVCKAEADPLFVKQRRSALLADIGIVSGAVLAGVGTVWFVKSRKAAPAEVRVSLQGVEVTRAF